MTLLNIREQATPADSKRHASYIFRLDESSRVIRLRFAYQPKALEDAARAEDLIKKSIDAYIEPERQPRFREHWERYLPLHNLITLSLDDPNGYRGACHRHDPVQELFLSVQNASPGLMPGKLHAGLWRVTLSFHAVVTERCDYELAVWTEDDPA